MKFEVGDKVRFVDEEQHEYNPKIYPPIGTVGRIIEVSEFSKDKEPYEVKWAEGSTSSDDIWWCSEKSIELAPHELTAMEFLEKLGKMCGYCIDCRNCPMFSENNSFNEDCRTLMNRHPTEAIRIVSEWEEPKQAKTIMDDFFEKFPKALKNEDGTPAACALDCGYVNDCKPAVSCYECWHTPLSESEGG